MLANRSPLTCALLAAALSSAMASAEAASAWLQLSAPVFQVTDLNLADDREAGFELREGYSGAAGYASLDGSAPGRLQDVGRALGWLGPVSASVGDVRGSARAEQDPATGVQVEARTRAPGTFASAVADTYFPIVPLDRSFGLNLEISPYTSLVVSAHYAGQLALDGLGCHGADCESAGYEINLSGNIDIPDVPQVQFSRAGGLHGSVPGAASLSPEGDALITLVNDSASPLLTTLRVWVEVEAYAPQLAAAVPEPQTWVLMCVGVVVLGLRGRRA